MVRASARMGRCAIALACAALPGACADPVHDDAVRALGAETQGVPPGPTHRAGQPCLTCHGGSGPAFRQLSIGGTVYAVLGSSAPALGAVVQIEDVDGRVARPTTNSAGNFFLTPDQFAPRYPLQMKIWSSSGNTSEQMQSLATRDGSCAGCHADSASPTSPGPVYLSATAPDGGAP
ncbi:MAG: hypothetical protein M3O50_21800 [Myxococcota bacterium]|nr:hypothetical protein [Myxococcota bacterium]